MADVAAGAAVVRISSEEDLIQVRVALRAAAERAGLGSVDQTKLVTACSELCRNVIRYAGKGMVLVEPVHESGRRGVRATFEDRGPGIDDVEKALQDGWSSVRSLGLGLPGAKRLMDEFAIRTERGKGTTVVVVKWGR